MCRFFLSCSWVCAREVCTIRFQRQCATDQISEMLYRYNRDTRETDWLAEAWTEQQQQQQQQQTNDTQGLLLLFRCCCYYPPFLGCSLTLLHVCMYVAFVWLFLSSQPASQRGRTAPNARSHSEWERQKERKERLSKEKTIKTKRNWSCLG